VFSPYLTMALAQVKADDLRRAADARQRTQHRAQPGRPDASDRSVALRFGSRADDDALAMRAASMKRTSWEPAASSSSPIRTAA
jgi:hypothetical protein